MKHERTAQHGFTLIELLLALSIFAIISLAIYSSFAGGVGAWRRAQEFSSIYQTARLLLDDMAHELKNAVAIAGLSFVGAPQRLSFVSVRQRLHPTGQSAFPQIARITYEVRKAETGGEYALFRVEVADINNAQGGSGEPELIAGSVSKVDFQYTYQNGRGEILPWKEVWETSDAIPLGVKITLTIGDTTFTKTVFIPHGYREREDKPKG